MLRFHDLSGDPELQAVRLASRITASVYGNPTDGEPDDESRALATNLCAKLVPSFRMKLHASVARAFGDTKTAKRAEASASKLRDAGAGY